jgi:hypothetical protein
LNARIQRKEIKILPGVLKEFKTKQPAAMKQRRKNALVLIKLALIN